MENKLVLTDKHELIDKLREVYAEKDYSYDKIISIAEKNGEHITKSTLSRLFGKDSTDYNFKYTETLKPIADVLLGINSIEVDDNLDVQAMKSILKFKIDKIDELQNSLKDETFAREKLEKELEQARRSIEFLKDQILVKDKLVNDLFDTVKERDGHIKDLLNEIIHCPKRKECL